MTDKKKVALMVEMKAAKTDTETVVMRVGWTVEMKAAERAVTMDEKMAAKSGAKLADMTALSWVG